MKKQFKNTVLALAMLASVSAAFVTQSANAASNAKQVSYDWIRFDRAGRIIGTLTNKTVTQAQSITGCTGTNQLCASAVSGPVIRYN